MHRDRRGFWYDTRRVGRRVLRRYLGRGPLFEAEGRLDALRRERARVTRAQLAALRGEAERAIVSLDELDRLAEALARAALLAAGYHQYKRGEWRRRREQGKGEDRTGGGAGGDRGADSGGAG